MIVGFMENFVSSPELSAKKNAAYAPSNFDSFPESKPFINFDASK
jgi:hypothetical protein